MKTLVQNLDQTKEELLQRLQSTMSEKRGSENNRAVLSSDIQQYQRDIIIKD